MTACSEMNEIMDDSRGDERKGLVTQKGLEGLFSLFMAILRWEQLQYFDQTDVKGHIKPETRKARPSNSSDGL